MTSSSPTVVITPGFAGGRLRSFNLILCALQANIHEGGTEVHLVLDENLFGKDDLRYPVQNAHGDVVYLDIPDHGKLSHGSRAAFRNALADTLPATADCERAMDDLLPKALATPLEAAHTFWADVFPNLSIETVRRGAPAPPTTMESPNITWGSARHFQTIKELGLELAWIFDSERRCLQELVPVPAGALGAATETLRTTIETQLQAVKKLSADVDPNLIGAWSRLRRNMREDMDQFANRADRCGSSRSGIQRQRVHSLTQALRPHDKVQEENLALISAVASFQLPYRNQDRCLTSLRSCQGPEKLLRTS
ncbi:MAG: bacillithiol biosynthesis BshC [Planctomycetota bacterium]